MSDGFIRWFQRDWSADQARRLVTALERAGWSLTNHLTGVISAVRGGGRQGIDRDDLLTLLALEGNEPVMFQWWLGTEGTDVYYDVRRLSNGGVVHEFDLDGVYPHLPKIERDVFRLVIEQRDNTVGAVFDRGGATQDLDWDPIMAGADASIDVAPDLLVLSPAIAELHPQLPYEHRTHHVDGLVVHDWENLYPSIADPA